MFKDTLYRIVEREDGEKGARFRVELNPEDTLFEGHFPGQPVLPAACMLEIGRELMEELEGSSLGIQRIKNMKIPAMVDPREVSMLLFDMEKQEEEGGELRCRYSVSDEETVFFKFRGTLSSEQ